MIQFAGWYHGYGNLVIVDHGGGITTYYAHLSSFELGVGDKVNRGTVVGYAGSTGRATSPHLHYELRIDGNAINPFQQVALDPSSAYFKSRSATSGSAPASPVKTQASVD
jgi:murein DD-endopeptidase MepM/ murein hydrolase activator NlpD